MSQAELLVTLRELARALPGAEEYTMVHHPAFRVGKKPYAIVGMNERRGSTTTLSVNLGPMMQGELLDDERFFKTPYLGQHGWVSLEVRAATKKELASLVLDSWRRVAGARHLKAHDEQAARANQKK